MERHVVGDGIDAPLVEHTQRLARVHPLREQEVEHMRIVFAEARDYRTADAERLEERRRLLIVAPQGEA